MRRLLVAIPIILEACAAPKVSPAPTPSATFPFHAVGRNVSGKVVEDLLGEARVYDNEIRIVVQRGVAGLQTTPTRRPIGLSAGLAYRHPEGGWDFRKQSPTVPIGSLKVRGDSLVAPVEFLLTGTRGLDLASHWIVIQQHRYTFVPKDGQWHEATRPIDSEATVFRTRR
jgi:hypothetical protein